MLTPGILTITPSGQLQADLSQEQPDQGTMVGLYPTLPYEPQIPSWLRDYLIKELDLFGSGPPYFCGTLYDQMVTSREVGSEGKNPQVESAAGQLSWCISRLRDSITELREFCSSGEPVCEETYAMEFGIVEGIIKKLAGWHPSQSIKSRLLATRPTNNESNEQSPAKRRKTSEKKRVDVAAPATPDLPRDIELLLDMGSRGVIMKGLLDSSMEDLVITPVSRLIDKLEVVYKGLRDEENNKKDQCTGGDHSSDSGVSACSP